jgi:hypothetical protein
LTKHQPEKKSESKTKQSYYDHFAKMLYDVEFRQIPVILKLRAEYDDLGTYLKELQGPEDRIENNLTLLQRRFIAQSIADLYGYSSIVSSLSMLGYAIDSLNRELLETGTIAPKKIDKKVKVGIAKIDKAIAKRLAQLLNLNGHEAMYGTGTKPPRSG